VRVHGGSVSSRFDIPITDIQGDGPCTRAFTGGIERFQFCDKRFRRGKARLERFGEFNRVGDQYDGYEDFKKDLAESIDKVKAESTGQSLTSKQITAVELNVKLKPGQADDPEWREKVNLIHDGYSRVSKRRPYYRNPDKILIITRPVKDSLAVGTTKRSVVKFWIGAGVLGREGDKYVDYIYSPKQLENGGLKKETINIAGLDGKNFGEIRILEDAI